MIEKLGVVVNPEPDKTASSESEKTCPNCLILLSTDTNVKCCPNCGTNPFESRDESN
jgi:uncharacterized paraquat-inducible protein A